MSEVPGLMLLSGSYEFAKIVDGPEELEITTFANVQSGEANILVSLGWVARAQNVYVYKKPSTQVVDVEEEVEQNFEIAEEPLLPEETEEIVEKETPLSAEGIMDDV